MDKQQFEKMAGQESGKPQVPARPEPRRRTPEAPERDREDSRPGEEPEGTPIDRGMPRPRPDLGGRDILEGERSDRESGRIVQLPDDNQAEAAPPEPDAGSRLGGRRRGDRRASKSRPPER
jgi:hypothetical protein